MLVCFSCLPAFKDPSYSTKVFPSGASSLRRPFRIEQLFLSFFLVMVFFAVCTSSVYAYSITLAWDPNAASEGVAGYKIYYGTESHNYTMAIDVSASTVKSVARLKKGMAYYFAATAYNSDGVESEFSEEVMVNTCVFNISPKKKSFKATGGEGTITVKTQPNCEWTASGGDGSMLAINEGHSGKGLGRIGYTVNPNPDPETRTTNLTVANTTFMVKQKGTGISD